MAAFDHRAILLSAGPVGAHADQGDDGIQMSNIISAGTRNTQYNAVNQYFQSNANPDQDQLDVQFREALCSSPQIDRTNLIDTKGETVDGTREWVLATEEYTAWLQDDSSPLLWIWGGPGKGKTMLSIFLSQELEKDSKTLYFFCSAQDEKRSTAVGVVRGLLWHLTHLYPKLTGVLRKRFDSTTTSAFSSRDTLWEAFGDLLKRRGCKPLHYILDGLDECDKDSQQWLAKKLESFSTRSVANGLKLIVVSRELSGFRDAIQLRLDSEYRDQVDSSVKAFVDKKVNAILERFDGNETIRQEVKNKLSARAQGTYLYVGFAAIELSRQSTINGIIEVLEDLPAGLSALYSRLLRNVEPSQQRIISRILGFVSLARRPLSLEELASATGCKPITAALDPKENIRDLVKGFGPLLRILDHGQLIRCYSCSHCFQMPTDPDVSYCPVCRSVRFVYVYNFHADKEPCGMTRLKQIPPPDVETVDLVHESVRDFLKDATLPDATRCMPDEMHFQLAYACLDGLVSSKASDGGFASYAVDFWPFHARNSGTYAKELLSHPSSFFDKESTLRTAWWRSMRGQAEDIPRLHMACLLGLAAWVDDILASHEQKSFLSFLPLMRRDPSDCKPLHAAIHAGSPQIVNMLLQHPSTPKASIETKLGGETVLYAATSRGHGEIVQLLVHDKANVNAKCGKGRTALHIASRRGYTDVVELLLLHQANPHDRSDFGTPLHEAADCGHADVAEILLRHGADVDAKRREYSSKTETALHIAAKEGQEALARLLLQHGADFNLLSEHGDTVVRMAVQSENEAVVKLLIGKADVNVISTMGETLRKAVYLGPPGIVKVLLEGGAGANGTYGIDQALYFAASHLPTRIDLFEILLEHGANVNATVGPRNETALHTAVVHGDEETVKILLEHAADVNARDLSGRTPLSAALM